MLTVHVRINDAATGKPTAVRLRITDAAGNVHVPFGRLAEFAVEPGVDVGGQVRIGTQTFAYIDGSCEVRLPAGTLHVEAHKGPEYAPLVQQVTLGPGQISLRLTIHRWTDWKAEGWYGGDTRATDIPPHAALLEAEAEDLAVVQLLAYERPGATPNLLAFSGTKSALESPGHAVVVNTLNAHPVLGTVALLNSHRPIYPLRSGAFPARSSELGVRSSGSCEPQVPSPEFGDDWSVADWCDQCHRKRGLVVWPDLPRLTAESPQGEALAALLLGKVDAFEIASFAGPEPSNLGQWYRLLDAGCKVPLAGGSGKDSNAVALGRVRTYAYLGGAPDTLAEDMPAAWIEAVRAGRTFITNGPLLRLTGGEQLPGALVRLPAAGGQVPIVVEAGSAAPFDVVEVLFNGRIVLSKEASGNRQATRLEGSVTLTESGWLAARCWGRDPLADGQTVYAHTSPLWVSVAGRPHRAAPEAAASLRAVLDRTLDWVQREARCPSEHQREQLAAVLRAAQAALHQRLGGG
jgi:hypothetical protein